MLTRSVPLVVTSSGDSSENSPSQGSNLRHRSNELLYTGCLACQRLGVLMADLLSS